MIIDYKDYANILMKKNGEKALKHLEKLRQWYENDKKKKIKKDNRKV